MNAPLGKIPQDKIAQDKIARDKIAQDKSLQDKIPLHKHAFGMQARALKVAFADAAGQRFTALDIGELCIPAGRFLAIIGPSGSGKSTLLYALAGLFETASGAVEWGGADLIAMKASARNAWRRATLGFVFQDFHLVPELSPIENVLMPARFDRFSAGLALKARAAELLDRFGVPASRRTAAQLSRGEQQRVAIARALLFDPPVILADEPTASLDAASATTVIDALASLAADGGKTVIAVSHDAALIARADTHLRLDHGRIAAEMQPT